MASTVVVVVVVVIIIIIIIINAILQKEYSGILRVTLKPELIVKNKITTNAPLAVPILRFSFCIIDWREEKT
jgi:hypothetical protein